MEAEISDGYWAKPSAWLDTTGGLGKLVFFLYFFAQIWRRWEESVCTDWKQDKVCVCICLNASIHTYACLRAQVSSTSYVLMSHVVLVTPTKMRLLVICSVSCSAPLNYSRPAKGWGLPLFSLSLSPLPPYRLLCFICRTWSGGRMKSPCVTAECVSLCHSPAAGW